MLCSINKLKSQMLLTRKNFMFSDFTWKKNFAPENGGGFALPLHPSFLCGPVELLKVKIS